MFANNRIVPDPTTSRPLVGGRVGITTSHC
jgi:hypothetical protein